MFKLLPQRKTASLIFASLASSLLVSCGVGTDKLLVFEDAILPVSLFDRLTGRYSAVGDDNFVSISNVNGGLYYEYCADGKIVQENFVVSKIPNQDSLYVMGFISFNGTTDSTGYPYSIFSTNDNGLNVWVIEKDKPVAKDYLPSPLGVEGNEASIYPVEETKNFLANYGVVYTQVNQPVEFKYVDNQPLSCPAS